MTDPDNKPNAILDTETSGLFDFSKPADAPGQPRLASFALVYVTAAPELAYEGDFHRLIKPDGWHLEPAAASINGLSMERLHDEGVPIAEVLDEYIAAVEAGRVIVAFNSQFDTKVMRAELRLAGRDDLFTRTPNICVMRPLTGVCKIPKKDGRGFKLPKLSEAMTHFKLPLPDAHTSLGDARAALDLFRVLHSLNLCPAPEVHFAKNRPGEPVAGVQ